LITSQKAEQALDKLRELPSTISKDFVCVNKNNAVNQAIIGLTRLHDILNANKKEEYNKDYISVLSNSETLLGLFENIVVLCIEIINNMEYEQNIPSYIFYTKNYIHKHYMEDLSLSEIAQKVYLNSWYLSTQFKKHTGFTISEYLNIVRINISKQLLDEQDLKVYQISEMVGYSDSSYFSTVFKGIEGLTPKQYRKNRREHTK
jgi:two-component system, response regulator YesN